MSRRQRPQRKKWTPAQWIINIAIVEIIVGAVLLCLWFGGRQLERYQLKQEIGAALKKLGGEK